MRLRFSSSRTTRVRIVSGKAELLRLLRSEGDFLWKDKGVPGRFTVPLPKKEWPGGEPSKSWGSVEKGLHWLAGQRAERSHRLVVLGGGAVLDFSALAASLYRRGLGLVLVPSTLLGMVDASLGGKTAVDGRVKGKLSKNFAGTFFPADEIWICTELLSTLPGRERVSGAAEVLKVLWLSGRAGCPAALAQFVETGKVSPPLTAIIRACLKAKIQVVEKDPLDRLRIREALNFGHTVGHALESLAGGRLSHGECVLWGMAVESGILGKKGMAMRGAALAAASRFGLKPPRELFLPSHAWEIALLADKKIRGGKAELTVVEAAGVLKRKRISLPELSALIKAFPESCQL